MKFWPVEWLTDLELQSASLATHVLWIELICRMWRSKRRGHLLVNGIPPSHALIGLWTGVTEKEATCLIAELRDAGVLSVGADGCIYSRRIADEAAAEEHRAEEHRERSRRQRERAKAAREAGDDDEKNARIVRAGDAGNAPKKKRKSKNTEVEEEGTEVVPADAVTTARGAGAPRGAPAADGESGGNAGDRPNAAKMRRMVYDAYPRRVAPSRADAKIEAAAVRIVHAMPSGSRPPLKTRTADLHGHEAYVEAMRVLLASTRKYAKTVKPYLDRGVPLNCVPHPATWFEQERYGASEAEWRAPLERHVDGDVTDGGGSKPFMTDDEFRDIVRGSDGL